MQDENIGRSKNAIILFMMNSNIRLADLPRSCKQFFQYLPASDNSLQLLLENPGKVQMQFLGFIVQPFGY